MAENDISKLRSISAELKVENPFIQQQMEAAILNGQTGSNSMTFKFSDAGPSIYFFEGRGAGA